VRGQWFSLGTPVSSNNKTDRRDITEILLESDVKHHKPNPFELDGFFLILDIMVLKKKKKPDKYNKIRSQI
jgi:hypothetical protein